MLSFLGDILQGIEDFPTLVLDGIVSAINGLLGAMGSALNFALSVLPSMPSIPAIPTGQYLGWLNWLYPVGDAVDLMVAAITMYLTYLAVRYLLSLLRFGGSE